MVFSQAPMNERSPGGVPPRPVAPHVRAAVGAVQARPAAPAAGARPAAPHVRAAVAAIGAAQARMPAPPGLPGPPARVQARTAGPAVRPPAPVPPPRPPVRPPAAIQPKVGFEYEIGYIKTEKRVRRNPERWAAHSRGEMIKPKAGYDVTADSGPNGTSQIEFIIKEVDENNRAECARAVLAATKAATVWQAHTTARTMTPVSQPKP